MNARAFAALRITRCCESILAIVFMVCGNALAASFQPAVDRAQPGAVIAVAPGEYESVVLNKPITLRGAAGAVIRGTGKGSVVRITANQVSLEGFHICHSGKDLDADDAAVFVTGNDAVIRDNTIEDSLHGIYVKKAAGCRIEKNRIIGTTPLLPIRETVDLSAAPASSETCSAKFDSSSVGNGVHLWNSERATLRGNQISGVRDGMYFSFTHHCLVIGNHIARVRFGLHYMYSDYNHFEANRFTESTAGASIMYSKGLLVRHNVFSANVGHRSYGLALTAMDSTRIEANEIAGNTVGIHLQLCNGNSFIGNEIARGYIGVRIATSSNANTFTQNTFTGNMHPVEIDGNAGQNNWALNGVGNRWGGGGEIDLRGNGIGALPHRETDLLGGLRHDFPLVALLSGSPALRLIGFAQKHAALPRIPAIIDPAPLTAAFHSNFRIPQP